MTAESTDYEGTSLLRRMRAIVLLAVLVVALGVVLAATLGVTIVGVTSLVNHALA